MAAMRTRMRLPRSKPRRSAHGLYEALRSLHDRKLPAPLERYPDDDAE